MKNNLNLTNALINAGAYLNTLDSFGLEPLHYGILC